jgi:hypothetical protein
VERQTPSKTKNETADIGVRAGYVGAPVTPGVTAPDFGRENE